MFSLFLSELIDEIGSASLILQRYVLPRRESEIVVPVLPSIIFDENEKIIFRQPFEHYQVLPKINSIALPVPKLPLPPLAQTLEEYLSAIEAVVTDVQYKSAKNAVTEFGASGGLGEYLQNELKKIYDKKENWVYDWWLEDMYMRNRVALPVNSNPGMVFPKENFKNQDDQIRFAMKLIFGILEYKQTLDNDRMPVDMSGGKNSFAFCMAQHYRLLTSYRRPDSPKDILVSTCPFHDGYHITVACKGQFYELKITQNDQVISQNSLSQELKNILAAEDAPEAPVGVLTSEHRDNWTNIRKILVKETLNENSLNSIERSLCVICFDDPLPFSFNYGQKLNDGARDDSNVAHQMLHGGGSKFNSINRWFDKTMQLVICSDGFCGLCYEHSAAEGVVVIQLLEKLIQLPNDIENNTMNKQTTGQWPPAKKLRWNVENVELQQAITSAKQHIDRLGKDLDFYVLRFDDYGRELAKRNQMSPDVLMQLALQLAYYKYKVHRRLVSTYESAATRRFHLGRVDNIRAATVQALNWVKVMEGDNSSEEKYQHFQKAVARQTEIMIRNITGQGIDCHLLALREVATERGIQTPSLFSSDCYAQFNNFRLSTSQVSTQTDSFMGYGAVVPDGYGASYNLKADSVLFCISSFHNCPDTNSALFAENLVSSLLQIKNILKVK
uniref:Choline O-acetyltransferase n=1 Tax=Strigamia maritima TaxID=126957 RepID=T1IUM8_STRMM